jgi:hypothetical protein
MKLKEIYQNLCYYDSRNPNADMEEATIKNEVDQKCYCDNCFYGRTGLALELLKFKSKNIIS